MSADAVNITVAIVSISDNYTQYYHSESLQMSAIKQSIRMSLHPLICGLECFTAKNLMQHLTNGCRSKYAFDNKPVVLTKYHSQLFDNKPVNKPVLEN